MSATRDDVKLNLLHILPSSATISTRVVPGKTRRDVSGLLRSSVQVFAPSGANISEAVAIVTGDKYDSRSQAVRGTFGGLNPGSQLVSELSARLHGSSTVLRHTSRDLLTPQAASSRMRSAAPRARTR